MNPPQPTLFIGHGSPMQAIESSRYTAMWEQLGRELPQPRAIVAVSAHWYTRGTAVTASARPPTIHDFYGFPAALNAIQYPAAGDPDLALRVTRLLQPAAVQLDDKWGLDHGTWSVLRHMYPRAQIPVIQLSLDGTLSPRAHYELAQRLAPLRDERVLVLGTGNVVHNLRAMRGEGAPASPWAEEFNDFVRAAVLNGDHAALLDYEQRGAGAAMSVPSAEHFLPLLYALALQRTGEPVRVLIDGIDSAAISMLSVQIGRSN